MKTIWTATEAKGSDEQKKPVYGPDFIGNALTGVCGPWFGNLLHLDFIPVQVEEMIPGTTRKVQTIKAEPFLFTKPHIDPDDPSKVPYLAGSRVDKRIWQKLPAIMQPDLAAFYRLIDKLAVEAKGLQSPILAKEAVSK